MSFSFGFYNALNHDRLYDAIQVSEIFDGLIRDGVYSTIGDHYVVKASENENEVIVGSGRAWFDHTWNKNDADLPITAPLPDLLMKRYDALVIDINANVASRTNQITWVEGTPSLNTPVKPTLTNTTDHHQYPLCYILRTANNNTIIQDDIENTIGTDECPFVTGILQQVSISDLLLQWTSQFATFMNNNEATASAWETEWEASMSQWTVEQKNEFATWMAGEKTEFDDWFANLHYILDGDVAGHLQNEIDAIEEGLGGSVFTIHTINSSLYGKTVTCTGSTQEKTAVFDASGNAEIKGITDVGTITFTATDGSQTATTQISVPYFSNYPITMAFWAATVNLSTTSEDLKGKTITIRKGGAVVASTSFNAAGTATYIATSAGTYTFTCQGYSVEQAITEETTYNVVINSGLDLSAWITAGSTTEYPLNPSSYANFSALESDEAAIRQLMLVHDAVDYLATASADDALIDDVINSDICAKWINICDYAFDTLSANVNIKSVMDEADKYGYGEIAPTKDTVPTMTGPTTPSGEVKASSTYASQYPAYQAFDKTNSMWAAAENTDEQWVEYDYETPVKLGWFYIKPYITISGSSAYSKTAKVVVQGYINNEWVDISEETLVSNSTTTGTNTTPAEIQGHISYSQEISKVRVLFRDKVGVQRDCIEELQFYAYEPKGNVPIMTADNAPYGTVSYNGSIYGSNSAWRAFDGNVSTYFNANNYGGAQPYIKYDFVTPIKPKKCTVKPGITDNANIKSATYTLKGSNDGGTTWSDSLGQVVSEAGKASVYTISAEADTYYMTLGLFLSAPNWDNTDFIISDLQFYGRELTPLVPTMTSNTTPKGTVKGVYSNSTNAYKAFDGDNTTYASDERTSGGDHVGQIYYEFDEPVICGGFGVLPYYIQSNGNQYLRDYIIKASNDGETWVDVDSGRIAYAATTLQKKVFANNTAYKYWSIYGENGYQGSASGVMTNGGMIIYTLQFYGSDYSEKEFATGSTRKTIYDHGVELVELEKVSSTNGWGPVASGYSQVDLCRFDSDEIYIGHPSAVYQQTGIGLKAPIDFSAYDSLGFSHNPGYSYESGGYCVYMRIFTSKDLSTGNLANNITTVGRKYINEIFDISNINQSVIFVLNNHTGGSNINLFGYGTFSELWLE